MLNKSSIHKIRLLIMGAPGSGKDTQAELLMKRFDIPFISYGNILREAVDMSIAVGMNSGVVAREYMDSGCLIPKHIISKMFVDLGREGTFQERIHELDCANGFVLDGPKTKEQAEYTSAMLDDMGIVLDAVINILVPSEILFVRLNDRRRSDDNANAIRARLDLYDKQVAKIFEYYEGQGLLHHVDGNQSVNDVHDAIVTYLRL